MFLGGLPDVGSSGPPTFYNLFLSFPVPHSQPELLTVLQIGSACTSSVLRLILLLSALPLYHIVQNGETSSFCKTPGQLFHPLFWVGLRCTLVRGTHHSLGSRYHPELLSPAARPAAVSFSTSALRTLHCWDLCQITYFSEPLVKVIEPLFLKTNKKRTFTDT